MLFVFIRLVSYVKFPMFCFGCKVFRYTLIVIVDVVDCLFACCSVCLFVFLRCLFSGETEDSITSKLLRRTWTAPQIISS
jgi:hypothetical protein